MQIVDLETARAAEGLRLVVLRSVPSPWSQAAKAMVAFKGIDARVVRMRSGDDSVMKWTGVPNAPVALYLDEPPRTGWAEILALLERLAPEPRLIPRDPVERVQMHGLAHELMGQQGVVWNARLLLVDVSLRSNGARGYPVHVAHGLAARYGYQPGCAAPAREQARESLALLEQQLAERASAGAYYLGATLSALDFYSAAVADALALLPAEQCPIHPALRPSFAALGEELGELPEALIAHRNMMHARHIPLPIEL